MSNNPTETLFEDYSEADAAEDKKKREGMDAGEWQKWEDGENWGRILPPKKGATKKSPFRIRAIHRIEIPGEKFKFVFDCLGAACPACIHREKLFKSPDADQRAFAGQLKAKTTGYFWWINRDNEDMGPRKAQVTGNVMQQIEKIIARTGSISDPLAGYDICIEVTPAHTKNNRSDYNALEVFANKRPTPLGTPEQMAAWAGALKDVESMIPVRSLMEIEQALRGEAPQRGDRQVGGRERGQLGAGGREKAGRDDGAGRGRRNVADDVIDAVPDEIDLT